LPFDISTNAIDLLPAMKEAYNDFVMFKHDDSKKLASSELFNMIIDTFTDRVKALEWDKIYPLKLIYLSAHDTSISGYMTALGAAEVYLKVPPFAS